MTAKTRRLRLAVATDVLASLPKLKVRTGRYFSGIQEEKLKLEEGSKVVARQIQRQGCEVCALGACFLSLVAVDNDFDFGQEANYVHETMHNSFRDRLSVIFSPEQLCFIESAFEVQNCTGWWEDLTYARKETLAPWLKQAVAFGKKHRSATARLRAIMQNIIDNHGVFTPPMLKLDLTILDS